MNAHKSRRRTQEHLHEQNESIKSSTILLPPPSSPAGSDTNTILILHELILLLEQDPLMHSALESLPIGLGMFNSLHR